MGTGKSTLNRTSKISQKHSAFESPCEVFDRLLACPVCFDKYNSHILLCELGHSVCKKCYGKLKKCPQCSSIYLGSRNYVLESIIAELERFQATPEKIVNDVLIAQITRFPVQKLKKSDVTCSKVTKPKISDNPDKIVVCKMHNCRSVFPLLDLKDHLHKRHCNRVLLVRKLPNTSKSNFSFNIYFANYQFVLDTNFGIFFLNIRVQQQRTSHFRVTAWIQGTFKDDELPVYYSLIQITINNFRATYYNFVNEEQITPINNETSKCLKFSAPGRPSDRLYIRGFLCNKFKNHPREGKTDVEILL